MSARGTGCPGRGAGAGRRAWRPDCAACAAAALAFGLLSAGAALAEGLAGAPAAAAAPVAAVADSVPGFAELEAAGATIGEIRVINRDIFDTSDPKEAYRLFKWANALHIQTRASVIERALLFKTGERLSVRLLEETERLLRSNHYLYDVQIRPVAYHDGQVDIAVLTRDTWSLDVGVSLSRSGGANSSGLQLREYNLLGTGVFVGYGRSSDVDRSSNVFRVANDRVFGSRATVDYSHASNSDGGSDALAVLRPFYALDARWAAGAVASRYDRIDAIYNAGNVVSEYRHGQKFAEAHGGLSPGLVDGWVNRYSVGLNAREETYALEPGRVGPAALPADQTLVGPFFRYQLQEDRFARELNRNLIGRPEFFELGLVSNVQLGWAASALGSTRDTLLYAGSVGRGFEPAEGQMLMARAAISGQYAGGQVQRQRLGAQTQYYRPQGRRWLFYASAAGDVLTHPDVNEELLLGGENGLRGYPLRYQSGTRRALFTAEERFYSDLYLWRLFRVGGAAFFDTGRAWGGSNTNAGNPGWLSDLGFGLRIVSARSAFGNVVHLDLAMPLNTTPEIDRLQFLVTTKASF